MEVDILGGWVAQMGECCLRKAEAGFKSRPVHLLLLISEFLGN